MADNKNRILNLFLDNTSGDITPEDMRTFVNTVFDNKENTVIKVKDFEIMDLSTVHLDDLVVIQEPNNPNNVNGIYLSNKDNPLFEDLSLIASGASSLFSNDFFDLGNDNEIISIIDGVLTWIPQKPGYYIKDSKTINEILNIIPLNKGEIFIAEDTNPLAAVPGVAGDGYSWDGLHWNNIGPLRGPAGEDGIDGNTGGAVVNVPTFTNLPIDGYYENLYVVSDTDLIYRWDVPTLQYVEIYKRIPSVLVQSQNSYVISKDYQHYEFTLTQDSSISISSIQLGQTGSIALIQDVVGGWNMQWGTFVFPAGLPQLNTQPGATNFFNYTVINNNVVLDFISDF